ncbi:23S rRNA (pseudouridine(1915)-N(3))-methyltransferase RlmH [Hornefia butyriciproducens]|uniref:23S rRNA (pseudouridine(1915)-N(3))-methyltransferase RlmH n=1 Tax=Hornefia butyriciproducens TaxID=2652293 RepID=UPI002A919064|nr:23S rRNA (pseudouridine(1915)-N(3))-methyltransferase RlmH [Hornefia butyriciproducens]MCI7327373.1 23S rRNA (pseudouridine(1915)-N(3))-methyltransferase RlmH [Clostridiales bacterium]MCI7412805.1 23S rRNA (pseudouridine(1915)-N(3))-methyltransferase RlmH [Clostridiales bacterium]MDY5423688.1 23S rRNA (pseudouridine(1915)-N(3))-methyltransferase RlmH [Hornefia butyriciproducens]MDY6211715.1 23S rRNA (pseudouridine(1915)-N(3))-methyltransferase RlmH [Hornefia butyriciproducens]
MNITVICIGKLKERYWREAVGEYSKRLGSYCSLRIQELKEARLPAGAGPAEEEAVKIAEGEEILSRVNKDMFVVSLEIRGKRMSSETLAEKLRSLALEGRSEIAFVIGGSLGLSEAVSRRADLKLSFSDMTFPHQMMRVILLEQIYRSFRIIRGEPYHK